LVHGFSITQKLDPIVLENIKNILHIKSKVRFRIPKKELISKTQTINSFYILDTTGKRAILNICDYFENNLKTVKSLEFKI
jgi:hypothetical protein